MFRNSSSVAGFAAGIAGSLFLSLAVTVLYNGQGLSDRVVSDPASVVYPNF
jgi:hypothetical protein